MNEHLKPLHCHLGCMLSFAAFSFFPHEKIVCKVHYTQHYYQHGCTSEASQSIYNNTWLAHGASHAQLYLFVQASFTQMQGWQNTELDWNKMYRETSKWHSKQPLPLSLCVSVYAFTLTQLAGNSSTRETASCYITVIVPPTLTALASPLLFYIRLGFGPAGRFNDTFQIWMNTHTHRQKNRQKILFTQSSLEHFLSH